MTVDKLDVSTIKGVAFDIDGTLYRTWKLNVRMSFYFLRHCFFFLKYGLVRNIMHRAGTLPDFVQVQADEMAKKLRTTPQEARARMDKVIYKGLEKYFRKIKPCGGSVEFIRRLKADGYKLALLSDFPPEQKGDVWGIKDLCDFIIGSEEAGALKPSLTPFRKLAEGMALPPEQILYVGNSHKYDVVGSKNAGMKSAWLISPVARFFGRKSEIADFTFCHYNQLAENFFEDYDRN
ncbi:MAG: HAD family hydrolase [Treponema sp.]|nr:HAD family hydrolase [Treponema sp.]